MPYTVTLQDVHLGVFPSSPSASAEKKMMDGWKDTVRFAEMRTMTRECVSFQVCAKNADSKPCMIGRP